MPWVEGLRECVWRNSPARLLIIIIIIIIFVIKVLFYVHMYQALGPVIGALISIIAVLGNEAVRYCSSTGTLRLSLDLERGGLDPGLDVEVFGDGGYRQYRVSAMVINNGNAIIKDAKVSLTIKVHSDNQETYYLGGVIIRRNQFNKYVNNPCAVGILTNNCQNFLVNEYNPHVIGESLAWALPEKVMPRPNSEYQHITSISPGQRNRLMIFTFTKLSDKDNVEYLVAPYSEYGSTGPYRACLRLMGGYELIFEVTVHGEGLRGPLKFNLCVTTEKLGRLENAVQSGDFREILQALSGLRC